MIVNICATPVSLAAFVVANVCENVTLHHLQDCLYYRIQEEVNYCRGCILMRNGFIFGGWGRGKVGALMVGIFGWWEGVTHIFLCMLTSKWMCRENGTGDHRLSDR